MYLTTPTAEVITAVSAEHGLQRMRNREFDIVLVDFEMPEINGIEFLRTVRGDPALAGTPVIMVTSHDDDNTIDRAYSAGATAFTTKPVNWRLLSYQIKYVLRAHKLLLERAAHV